MPSPKFLIERILPSRRVHLFGGASGANKTTYLFQTLLEWQKGNPVHSQVSHPVPWVYVSCDRPSEETEETLERMEIPSNSFHKIHLMDDRYQNIKTLPSLISTVVKEYPDARFLVIDAFYVLTPEGKYSDNATVNEFLRNAQVLCRKHDLTILGTTHAPKMKENDLYVAARDCLLGAIAWGGFSSTVMFIRSIDPENQTCKERVLIVLPRNGAPISVEYVLDDHGRLRETPPKNQRNPTLALQEFVSEMAVNDELDMSEAAAISGVSRQYTHRILMELVRRGALAKVTRGVYKRISESPKHPEMYSQSIQ